MIWGAVLECLARALRMLGFTRKPVKVLFLGLDNAGKTTLMYAMKHGPRGTYDIAHDPTFGLNIEEMEVEGHKVRAYDLGGRQRDTWPDYLVSSGCVVFVVDASDPERFAESKAELDALLSNVELYGVPFVVFGNKCDLEDSVSEREFRDAMGLSFRRSRPIDVFMCSARERYGFKSGMRWVSHFF